MKKLLPILFVVLAFASCTTVNKTMKQPHNYVQLHMDDFSLSEQESAKATSVTVAGIDFQRLFLKKMGSDGSAVVSASSVPIIGQYLGDRTTSYAMYDLLEQNDDADFIFYPQIEKKTLCPVIGICFINKITTVTVKAKLGTFK